MQYPGNQNVSPITWRIHTSLSDYRSVLFKGINRQEQIDEMIILAQPSFVELKLNILWMKSSSPVLRLKAHTL